jgi:aldehyde dehydrogenase (NAD+)
VVNLLTGFTAELAPWLAAHRDVNALDVTGAPAGLRADLQAAAADNVKRVYVPRSADWAAEPGLARLSAFVETKTVWHPVGA